MSLHSTDIIFIDLFRNSKLQILYSTIKSTAKLTIVTTVKHHGNALTDTVNANRVQYLALQVPSSTSS